MAKTEEITFLGKKTQTVFVIIENAARMHGAYIGAINWAMRELSENLRALQENVEGSIQINVAVLTVGHNGVRWVYEAPVPAYDFVWEDIDASGMPFWSGALKELESKLSRKNFLSSEHGILDPIIFFVVKNESAVGWQEGISILEKNVWYQTANKVGIAIDEAAVERLMRIVGKYGRVFVARSVNEVEQAMRDGWNYMVSSPKVDLPIKEESAVIFSTVEDIIWNDSLWEAE